MKLILNKTQSLEQYFKEVGEVELLTPQEEIGLAIRIKQNDRKALKKLVSANLRFVISVSKKYQNHGMSLEDLINEGNLGLMKAAHRFDETRGFKFISYAVWWIRQGILQAIAEKTRLIRLPMNRVGTLTKIGKIFSQLEQRNDRAPTSEEIADVLEIDSEQITFTLKKATRAVSMDSAIHADGKNRLMDILPNNNDPDPDADIMDQSLIDEVNHILHSLSDRESRILKLYYGLDGEKAHTLEEVGIQFRLTKERIRQIKEKALNKLRNSSLSKVLLQYL
ncbi:MAG: RNA polymerase sigma factor RpoD/SigA [Calditrichia bacterium]|nr:RNA polymerase sigma factor RpoD/SigA [Calditrichia bacterium]